MIQVLDKSDNAPGDKGRLYAYEWTVSAKEVLNGATLFKAPDPTSTTQLKESIVNSSRFIITDDISTSTNVIEPKLPFDTSLYYTKYSFSGLVYIKISKNPTIFKLNNTQYQIKISDGRVTIPSGIYGYRVLVDENNRQYIQLYSLDTLRTELKTYELQLTNDGRISIDRVINGDVVLNMATVQDIDGSVLFTKCTVEDYTTVQVHLDSTDLDALKDDNGNVRSGVKAVFSVLIYLVE